MTDLPVRWGDGSFKKWGNPSNGGEGLVPLYGL